ncbi:MAG: GDSL-type esterase/lipase family protein [bacterium]
MLLLKKNLTFFTIIYITVIILYAGSCRNDKTDIPNLIKHTESLERKEKGRIILTIGDSNGVVNGGWPAALQTVLKKDSVINNSEGGRTIGFDNCGNPNWNAIRNIESYLKEAVEKSCHKPIDEVIILLGTNDSKACFEDRKDEVIPNLITLITQIRSFDNCGSLPPHITLVTPPPYGPDSMVAKKALGGDKRVCLLVPQYREVALKYDCAYVNIYPLIKPIFDEVVMDHVHLTREGHKIVADAIASVLNDWEAPEPPSDIGYENNFLTWDPSESNDVIGYEVIRKNRIIRAATRNRVRLPSEITDISVRARDGYGNVSVAVTL